MAIYPLAYLMRLLRSRSRTRLRLSVVLYRCMLALTLGDYTYARIACELLTRSRKWGYIFHSTKVLDNLSIFKKVSVVCKSLNFIE